jgi:hypothetical protein
MIGEFSLEVGCQMLVIVLLLALLAIKGVLVQGVI